MSLSRGTLLSVVRPWAIRHAARIGRALFLDPEISILPLRRTLLPPRMRKLSIQPVPEPGPRRRPRDAGAAGLWPRNARPRGEGKRHPGRRSIGLSAGPSADDQSIQVARNSR